MPPTRTEPAVTGTQIDVDRLLARLTAGTRGTAAGRVLGLARAAEHLVADIGDSATAATPHDLAAVGSTIPSGLTEALEATVRARVERFLGQLRLVSVGQISGWPSLPPLTGPTRARIDRHRVRVRRST